MKLLLKLLIILDVLFIIKNIITPKIYLNSPVFLLIILSLIYLKVNGKIMKIFKKLFREKWLVLVIMLAFFVRFFGIFYPEHFGLVEQEIYGLPIYAVFFNKWLETFNQFTSFEVFGLLIQTVFFKISTYFDFSLLIKFFHFLFPEHYYFLNIPAPNTFPWPGWTADGTYGGLKFELVDRYALNYFLIRLVSVIFGTLTVLQVYFIGKKLFNKSVGLFSALVLGTTFIHVAMSMIGRQYIISGYFISLAFWASINILLRVKLIDYIITGVCIGLVNSVKVFPSVIIPFFIASLLNYLSNIKENRRIKRLIINGIYLIAGIFGLTIAFLAVSPTLFIYPENFLKKMTTVLGLFSGTWSWGQNYFSGKIGLPNWLWWWRFLNESGIYPPLFLTVVFGSIISISRIVLKKSKTDLLLLSAVLPYSILLIVSSTRREEFIIFIIPFIAVYGGIFLDCFFAFFGDLKIVKRLKIIIMGVGLTFFILIPLTRIILFDYSIRDFDNRTKALNWIESNVPKGSFIYIVGPYIQKIPINKSNYLVLSDDILRYSAEYLQKIGVDTIIIPAIRDLGQYIYHPDEYKNIINNLEILNNSQLKSEFYHPFFKYGFFSRIITLGDLINEHFDNPIQIYTLNNTNKAGEAYLLNRDFFNQASNIYKENQGFKNIDKLLFSVVPQDNLQFMVYLGSGKYLVSVRIKNERILANNNCCSLFLGDDINLKNLGDYMIKGGDFKGRTDFQEFVYPVSFSKASKLYLKLTNLNNKGLYFESIKIIRQ